MGAVVRALLTTLLACALLSCMGAEAVAVSAPPCSRGCDVPVGTYEGKNDQGDAVLLHVSVGHLKSGPHIVSTVHIIDRFKTQYVVDCGAQGKANAKFDTTQWGHIEGVAGHLNYGEHSLWVLWAPNEPITGMATFKSRACTGSSQFTLHRTGP